MVARPVRGMSGSAVVGVMIEAWPSTTLPPCDRLRPARRRCSAAIFIFSRVASSICGSDCATAGRRHAVGLRQHDVEARSRRRRPCCSFSTSSAIRVRGHGHCPSACRLASSISTITTGRSVGIARLQHLIEIEIAQPQILAACAGSQMRSATKPASIRKPTVRRTPNQCRMPKLVAERDALLALLTALFADREPPFVEAARSAA